MPYRFLSDKQLAFTIPGRPLCQGAINETASGGGAKAYGAIIKLACKYAMAAQNWEREKGPLYLVLTVCLGPGKVQIKHLQESMLKGDILAARRPNVARLSKVIIDALKGLAFEKESQIVGLLVVKRYTKQQKVEVLLGAPKNYRELSYDLRNA